MIQSSQLTAIKRRAKREGWAKWIRSEADERAALNGCVFDEERADYVVDFFPRFLRHSKDPWRGKPFELLEWQRDDVIKPIFGWIRPNGFRRFTRAWIEIPKKNGKSTLGAGLGLYMLTADDEGGAEVYSVANDRNQASIVHGEAIQMVEASPELLAELKINRSTKNIYFPDLGSWYRALSGDGGSNEGLNIHCVIADEIHSWRGRVLFDAIRYGMRARKQPLFAMITTAGTDPQSVAKEQHDHARSILDGAIFDDRYFAYIRAADPEDDPLDPKTWEKANPSYGITINSDEFAEDAAEAAKMPSSFAAFKRYSLNMWLTGEQPAIDIHKWNANRRDYTAADLRGETCLGGLDLAKVSDSTSLQLLFPGDDGFRILSYFWMPEESARVQNDRVSWLRWAEEGLVFLTPGDVCDYRYIVQTIGGKYDAGGNLIEEGLIHQFEIEGIAYDPYNAEQVTQTIEEEFGIPRHVFPQTMKTFAEPTGEFERQVYNGTLYHPGHQIMTWQIGNMQFRSDPSGNKRPSKPGPHDYRKIDGPVALIMALGLHNAGGASRASYYDDIGDDNGVILI